MAYGKCSPDGRSLRLGGNTSVVFGVVFSCIFQCPAFPRWSFYTARGEHLWCVFLEMLCQSYSKQTLGKNVFMLKLNIFDEKLSILVVLGTPDTRSGTRKQKKEFSGQKLTILGGHVDTLSVFVAAVF